jgi:hypothetical protein
MALRNRVPRLDVVAGGGGGGGITGTGAITVAGPQVSGAGTVSAPPITGTGQVAIAGPVVSGSGTVAAPPAISGTAAVTIAGPTAAGNGTVGAPAITGTGAVSIRGPSASGSGTVDPPAAITGTGAVTVRGPQVSGTGTVAAPGAITGAGAVSIAGPVASGTGTVSAPAAITGTGAVGIAGPSVSGSGTVTPAAITGAGGISISGPTVAGSGTVGAPSITGAGAVSIQGPQVSGAGTVAAPSTITGTGAVTILGPAAAGSGTVDPPAGAITGTGAVSIRGPSTAGAGGLGTGPGDLLSAVLNASSLASVNVGGGPTNESAWFDIKPDGTTAYFCLGHNPVVYQFTLSTPRDIATATYSGKSFSVAAQIVASRGNPFVFSPDGLNFFMSTFLLSSGVYRYTLTTAWDISTASYTGQFFDLASQDSSPNGLAFRPDGTRMFVLGYYANQVFQYSLSTPWNLTTASYDGVALTIGLDNGPRDICFSSDGSSLYVTRYDQRSVAQYSLPSPWSLSGASFLRALNVNISGPVYPYGIRINPAGTRLYVKGENRPWYQYDFYTPPITGAGSVAIGGPTVAGTGSATAEEITGSGAVTIAGPSLAGAGTAATPPITGSGGIVIKGPAVSGAGCVNDELTWVGATMPFTAKTILESAAVILSDAGGNRWPWPELLGWLSGALREIAIIKPSATADVIEVQLQCGTKQRVPAGYHQMLDATRNLLTSACSPTGRSGGQAITTVTRDEIDAAIPGWHNPAILPYAKAVHHVVDADADPMTFYVVPGNDGTGLIEVTASVMPAELPIPANPDLIESYASINIPMPNAYQEAVLNFVIYRALSKDSMVAGAAARAQAHLALFQQTLGIKQDREETQNVNRPTHRHSR